MTTSEGPLNESGSPTSPRDDRSLLESDLRGQTRVLRRLAQGASLDEVLHTLIEVAEESRPEMIGSILLVDEETGCLRHGASRRLPEFYCRAIDGVMPGPEVGSCGTAVYTGKRVIVEDIRTAPSWEIAREVALRASLHACWSEPIFDSSGQVLGSFAMYYREPRSPDRSELDFVESCASVAALAIERVRYQSRVEHERAILKAVVNAIPDALVLVDLNRRITQFSRGASAVFGYEPGEVLGRDAAFLYANREDYERVADRRFESEAPDSELDREFVWRRKSGETFPGEVVGAVVLGENDEAIGFLGLVRDITDRKLAEARLHESQAKLVQAERLAAMGQMVSAIAHESRNALQRIQVGVDVLQYEIDSDSDAREDLERIIRAKADLQRLHDDLRSVAGPIHLRESVSNLAEAWRQAWRNLQVSRHDRNAELIEETSETELDCRFDAFRMEQVFRNLFENSLAACEDPVRVTLRCRRVEGREGTHLVISIRDNGPGLSSELRSHVFEAFYTTKSKGTGLGMAIAKRFVEAHQGTIDVEEGYSDGAGFVLTLPRKTE